MKSKFLPGLFAGFALCLVALTVGRLSAQTTPSGDLHDLNPTMTQSAQRPGIFATGGATTIDASAAAAAYSAALTPYSRYALQCDDNAYFSLTTAASGQDADSGDIWIAAGAIIDIMTDGATRYISVLDKTAAATADCHYQKYQ